MAASLYVPFTEKLPAVELNEIAPAVENPPLEMVMLTVTDFFGEELSETTSEVLPVATPLMVTTFELIDAVAIEFVGWVVIE